MAARELSYKITTDAKQGIAGIQQFGTAVKREMRTAETALDDTRSAGQRAADALGAMADRMESELAGATSAAQALELALGDSADRFDTAKAVGELRKLGLSFDDIEADAEALAEKLRRLDQIDVSAAGAGFDHFTDSAGKAQDATNSFVGNAVSELPGVSDSFGPLGEAVGQMTEGLLGGEIAMSGLVAAAGPIAGVLVAVKGISTVLEGMKFEKQFKADLVDKFVDSVKEGRDALADLRTEVEETGKLEFADRGGFLSLGKEANNVLPILARLRIDYDGFLDLVKDPSAVRALREQADALRAQQNLTGDPRAEQAVRARVADLENAADAAEQYAEANGTAKVSEAELEAFLGINNAAIRERENALRLATSATEGIANTLAQQVTAEAEATAAAEAHTEAVRANAEALLANADALTKQVDGYTNAADAELAAVDAATAYADALADTEASTEDQRDAAITSAKANLAWAEAMAEASGKSLTATQKVDAMNDSLVDAAAQAKGPTRDAILSYIQSLNSIPPDKQTNIAAAIARGDLETAKVLLDEASAPRDAAIVADADTADAKAKLDAVARAQYIATIDTHVKLPNGWTMDKYGNVRPPNGGAITVNSVPVPPPFPGPTPSSGAAPLAAAAPTSSRAGNTTINLYTRAASGRETTRELERWRRVNGGR